MAENKDDNVVFVGTKPFMNYVTSVIMQFTTKGQKEVIIKARGKFISRAVDISEVVRKKFLKDQNVILKNISGKHSKKLEPTIYARRSRYATSPIGTYARRSPTGIRISRRRQKGES